jgi:capsular polysaccharide biosynthesis protein
VQYYHQHYASTIERLFAENGYEIVKPQKSKPVLAAEVADET